MSSQNGIEEIITVNDTETFFNYLGVRYENEFEKIIPAVGELLIASYLNIDAEIIKTNFNDGIDYKLIEKCEPHSKTFLDNQILIYTGGIMAKEFSKWCEVDPYVINCTNMNPNTGAWKVSIKRSIRSKKDKTPDTALDLTALYKKFNSR